MGYVEAPEEVRGTVVDPIQELLMSRIAILGGHGKVALRLAPLLVEAGHTVTSVIRNPDHSDDVVAVGATPLVADLEQMDVDEIADALRGHDAVVWSAGAGGGNPARTYAVDREAAVRTMDASSAAGVDRYVMVSYLGAGTDHGVDPDSSFFAYAEAKAAADEHLRSTDLAWTILGPGALTLDPGTGRIEIAERPARSDVTRDDVARVAAEVLARPDTAGQTIGFNNGETPIPEALSALSGA